MYLISLPSGAYIYKPEILQVKQGNTGNAASMEFITIERLLEKELFKTNGEGYTLTKIKSRSLGLSR
jgi:hypothetical protein